MNEVPAAGYSVEEAGWKLASDPSPARRYSHLLWIDPYDLVERGQGLAIHRVRCVVQDALTEGPLVMDKVMELSARNAQHFLLEDFATTTLGCHLDL